jgi:hypothetical protein
MESLVEMMKKAGFTPSVSTEGEWQPYEGYYKVAFQSFTVKDTKKDGTPCNKYAIAEFKIEETLSGRSPKEGATRAEFSKFITLTGDQAVNKKKGLPLIINAIYTADKSDVIGADDESTFANIQNKIGLSMYIHAFKGKTWIPGDVVDGKTTFTEDKDAPAKQDFSFVKEEVARKKAEATPF